MASVIRGDDNFDTAENGRVVQVVNFQTDSLATGTGTIPFDDTTPQITEGTEFMTLAITPKSASNKLLIEVEMWGSNSITATLVSALFVGTTSDALAATAIQSNSVNSTTRIGLRHTMTTGVTTALTFRVRAGSEAAATLSINGNHAGRKLGSVSSSSITITEYAA